MHAVLLVLLAAIPQGRQPEQVFKPDLAIVADEIDQFDGTVTRNIYCFKMLPNDKGELKLMMIGNMASHPENIVIKDDKIVWKNMEIQPKKLYTYKGAPEPIREYVKSFDEAEKLWFGMPMNSNPFLWLCPCCP